MNVWLRVIVTWVSFIPVAIINGIIRNDVYQKYVGELVAHQISTVIGCMAFVTLAYFVLRDKVGELNNKSLWAIGFLWVLMTIVFEFIFGHYVAGHSWEKLFYDYNIFAGRVWVVFLLNTLLTPVFVKKLSSMFFK